MSSILILYFSKTGSVEKMARECARGVESVSGCTAVLRTVPTISERNLVDSESVPDSGPPYAELEDLAGCDGLLLGSPTRFGNMAAPLQYFLEKSSGLWMSGALINKPAAVFTSTGSDAGGKESTLLSMAHPLLHHGMVFAGLPYENFDGSPYGVAHQSGMGSSPNPPSADTLKRCFRLGARVAALSKALSAHNLINPKIK